MTGGKTESRSPYLNISTDLLTHLPVWWKKYTRAHTQTQNFLSNTKMRDTFLNVLAITAALLLFIFVSQLLKSRISLSVNQK